MKKVWFGLPLAALFAASSTLAQEIPSPPVKPETGPRLLLSRHGSLNTGSVWEMRQYSALIDAPGQGFVLCAGMKVDFSGEIEYAKKHNYTVNPQTFVSSAAVADLLRPSGEAQPENGFSYGSCRTYATRLPPDVLDAVQAHDDRSLDYIGDHDDMAYLIDAQEGLLWGSGNPFINEEENSAIVRGIKPVPRMVFADPQAQRAFNRAVARPLYKLDMPACVNTGYNEDIAAAVYKGKPLQAPILLRDCKP